MLMDNRQFFAEAGFLRIAPFLLPPSALEENEIVPRGTIRYPPRDFVHRAHGSGHDGIRLNER
jgi:hypothetical protein